MKWVASWFATFSGWALCWTASMAWQAWRGHGRGIGDFEFLLWWPLGFTLVGWIVVGLPLVARLDARSRLLDLPWSLACGAGVSWVAFVALIGWSLWNAVDLHLFAAGVGGVALPVYGRIVRRAQAWEPRRRSRIAAVLAAAPFAVFGFVRFGAWPVAERSVPALVYPIASHEAQSRMTVRALRRVRVGDRLAELRARCPYVFERDMAAISGNAGDVKYAIRFRDGVVREVSVEPARQP